ncbi:MAG: zf-HC2 domain-containing protein [Chloroflexota bacterium]
MKHRPFEDWLLNDERLTPEQKRELQTHLRGCRACTALAEVNLALRSARGVAPAPGFAARFQSRLAAQRALQRRRMAVGATVLTVGGLAILSILLWPFVAVAVQNPTDFLVSWALTFAAISGWIEALVQAGAVIGRVIPSFVPPYGWMILFSAVSGLVLLWGVSFWRFTRVPRHA